MNQDELRNIAVAANRRLFFDNRIYSNCRGCCNRVFRAEDEAYRRAQSLVACNVEIDDLQMHRARSALRQTLEATGRART